MHQRKSYTVPKTGSLHNLRMQDSMLGEPGTGEVTVAVKAIGLNYADIFAVLGLYSATPEGPFIPGLEYAGDVVAVGSGVSRWNVGDKVMGVTRFGAYTTHLTIDARYIFALPQNWRYEEGAAFLVQVLTAFYALVPLGNLQKGQAVLIHSAAGGVGIQANRIAQRLGAYTVGVVGHQAKYDLLKKEGYHGAVVRTDNFRNDVRQALQGRELNLVLEAAGGRYFTWSYQLLAPQGRLVTYGSAGFTPTADKPFYPRLIWQYLTRPKVDPLKMTRENKSVMGFNLIWIYDKVQLMHQLMDEITALQLPAPHIGHEFTFRELPQALKLFMGGQTTGKLVVHTNQ
jgi:NADPH:quinone reductase-like Zn-dependent oxidoreductase